MTSDWIVLSWQNVYSNGQARTTREEGGGWASSVYLCTEGQTVVEGDEGMIGAVKMDQLVILLIREGGKCPGAIYLFTL